jgi:hypothetical protein
MNKFVDNSKKTDAHSTLNSSCETTAFAYPNPSFPEQSQLNQPPVLIHTQINSSELPDFSFENVTRQASLPDTDTEDDVYSLYSQPRPHQRQRERVSMNFKSLRQFEEFNGELKENLQKKSNLVSSIISHIHM